MRADLEDVAVAGVFRDGREIAPRSGTIGLPRGHVDAGEELYIVESPRPKLNIRAGDILVVKRVRRLASGRLVLARLGKRVYLGYWWTRQKRRALLDENMRPIVEDDDLRVLGVVTLSIRQRYGERGD